MGRRKFWSAVVACPEDLDVASQALAVMLPSSGVICLHGEMGAGKTTFTSALCRTLGVTDQVSSPTFAIINEYRCAGGMAVFHLDCYRLESLDEALSIGCEEYFNAPNALCIVEWPDVVTPILPLNRIEVHIEVEGEKRRFEAFALD